MEEAILNLANEVHRVGDYLSGIWVILIAMCLILAVLARKV